jgi:transcriptional regulator with XRE-family HTH domain
VSVAPRTTGIGGLIRSWRMRRHMSQLELALQADVSQRHLSFIEIGRSKPSREMVLHLAAELGVPLRERNVLLLASGYAPAYSEIALEAVEFLPIRHALEKVLSGHEPFPAIAVDRGWNLVWSNEPARTILTASVAPELLAPRPNAMRVSLHPAGLAPRIANFREYSAHLVTRLRRQAAIAPDPVITALYDEVRSYPTVSEASDAAEPEGQLFTPLKLRALGDQDLAFFSTIATFGTALDITLAELSIESFFPADKATYKALRSAFS